jgi:hypothetical protein
MCVRERERERERERDRTPQHTVEKTMDVIQNVKTCLKITESGFNHNKKVLIEEKEI